MPYAIQPTVVTSCAPEKKLDFYNVVMISGAESSRASLAKMDFVHTNKLTFETFLYQSWNMVHLLDDFAFHQQVPVFAFTAFPSGR